MKDESGDRPARTWQSDAKIGAPGKWSTSVTFVGVIGWMGKLEGSRVVDETTFGTDGNQMESLIRGGQWPGRPSWNK